MKDRHGTGLFRKKLISKTASGNGSFSLARLAWIIGYCSQTVDIIPRWSRDLHRDLVRSISKSAVVTREIRDNTIPVSGDRKSGIPADVLIPALLND